MKERRLDSDAFTSFDFISHIDLARTVISHHDDSETWSGMELLHGYLDVSYDTIGQCFDIENHLSEEIC